MVVPDGRSPELVVLELVTLGLAAVVELAFGDVVGEGAGTLEVGATVRMGLALRHKHRYRAAPSSQKSCSLTCIQFYPARRRLWGGDQSSSSVSSRCASQRSSPTLRRREPEGQCHH